MNHSCLKIYSIKGGCFGVQVHSLLLSPTSGLVLIPGMAPFSILIPYFSLMFSSQWPVGDTLVSTFTILAITKLFSVHAEFFQNYLPTMWKVLETLLLPSVVHSHFAYSRSICPGLGKCWNFSKDRGGALCTGFTLVYIYIYIFIKEMLECYKYYSTQVDE